MSLKVEIAHSGGWRLIGELHEADPPGSMTHNPPEGARQVVLFTCCGQYSLIERSRGGGDITYGTTRAVAPADGPDKLPRRGAGEQLGLLLRPDALPGVHGTISTARIRFRHLGPV